MKYKILIFSLLASLLLFPAKAFAGGGYVSFTVSPAGMIQPGQPHFVKPIVHRNDGTNAPCDNCPITLKFVDPKPSDVIAQDANRTNDKGTIDAKAVSFISGSRLLYAVVEMPDGTMYTSSYVVLNYFGQTNANNTTVQPVTKVVSQEPIHTQSTDSSKQPVSEEKTEALNRKIDALQKQLEDSQKKQSVLEETVNKLTNLLKSLFPHLNFK